MPETKRPDWPKIFANDITNNKYLTWTAAAREGRKFMDQDFTSLQKFGMNLDDPKKPWVKVSTVRRTVQSLKGKAFSNPINWKVAPYEGMNVEEDVTKVSDCLLKFEARAKRGPFNRNLLHEVVKSVEDGLVTGRIITDARIDTTMRDPLYYNGKPIYERLQPENVVLDGRAQRLEDIWHQFIIMSYSKNAFEVAFGEKADTYRSGRAALLGGQPVDTFDTDSIEVVEVQYIQLRLDSLIEVPPELAREILLQLPEGNTIWKQDLQQHLMQLSAERPEYAAFDLDKVVQGLPHYETQRWAVYSTYFCGDRPLLKGEEYLIGPQFSVIEKQFFPTTNSPYAHGVPFFLTDLQMLEVLTKSMTAKLLLRANKVRTHVRGTIDDPTKAALDDDMGTVVEWGDQLDENRPIGDSIMFEKAGDALPWIMQFGQALHRDIGEQFGTLGEGEGELPYAGAPAKLIDRLIMAGSVMFASFKMALNEYFPEIFDRALRLAVKALPRRSLMTIAGENSMERAKLIATGKFYERIDLYNVNVELDLTTPQERAMQKQIMAELFGKGQIDPETALTFLEFPEPKMTARKIIEWQMKMNERLALGTEILEDENLSQVILPQVQQYKQMMMMIKKRSALQTK